MKFHHPAVGPTAPGTGTTGDGLVTISYSAADQSYTISLPEYVIGKLVNTTANGSYDATGWTHISSTWSRVSNNPVSSDHDLSVTLDWPASSQFTYTNFGSWFGSDSVPGETVQQFGSFAYGLPTAPGDIPLVGTASYAGELRGMTSNPDYNYLTGNVAMDFDFASGALGGKIDMVYNEYYNSYVLPTMPFHDTVHAAGSTTFSGKFDVAGLTSGTHFDGRFTGPGGAELMANFGGTLTVPQTKSTVDIVGVWIAGKK